GELQVDGVDAREPEHGGARALLAAAAVVIRRVEPRADHDHPGRYILSRVPELPDVELYLAALRPRVLGHAVQKTRVASPFFVRTFDPPLTAIEGRVVMSLARVGKRLVLGFE